jgi:CspA family cold shock protein
MATGRINTLRNDKGFGFIKTTAGSQGKSDLFFHRSAVEGAEFDDLFEGQEVEYEEERDPRDPSRFRANHVRPVPLTSTEEVAES